MILTAADRILLNCRRVEQRNLARAQRTVRQCVVDGITPRLPIGLTWTRTDWQVLGTIPVLHGVQAVALARNGVQVLSSVESPEGRPEYHVSVSVVSALLPHRRRAPTDQELEEVRAVFGMGGADEDNHGPGFCRHLWLDVGKSRQTPCPCKQDEDRIVEGDRVRFEEAR